MQQSEAGRDQRDYCKVRASNGQNENEEKTVKEYEETRQGKAKLKSLFVLSIRTLPGMRAGWRARKGMIFDGEVGWGSYKKDKKKKKGRSGDLRLGVTGGGSRTWTTLLILAT